MMALVTLYEGTLESFLALSATWEHSDKSAVCKLGGELSRKPSDGGNHKEMEVSELPDKNSE